MDARPLSLHIDSQPSASPFPSPSSSFLPPPMPGAHEFAVKPPPLPRKSTVSTPPVDPLTLDTSVEPRRQSHPISSPTILNSPSLASSRPAPLSPASSRRVSTISAKSSSLSRSSSTKRGSTGFSKRLSALSMTGIMTRKDDESLMTPTVSMNLPSSSSTTTTILSSSTPPPPLRNSTTVSGSTSTSAPAPHHHHSSKPRRPTSTKIKIRDFAYPSVDNRYRGLGIDVPKPNQFSRLNKKLGGSKKARPSSKRWSDGSEDDEKNAKTKTIMKRKKKKEKEKKKKKEEEVREGRNNNGWDESDNEDEEEEDEDDTSTSTDEDEDEDEDEEEEEEEEEYEEPGWFKKGMGRLSWSFGFSGFKKQFSDDLDTPTSNNNNNNNTYPSRGEMEMNFSGTPTTTTTNEDQTPSSTTSEDDEQQQQSQEEEEEEEPPLYPGLYRALYPFEPEGTAEMRLKEDQVVRVVGRGGGVGWAVVVVPEDVEGGVVVVMDNEEEEGGVRHALVPESYLEVVQLD